MSMHHVDTRTLQAPVRMVAGSTEPEDQPGPPEGEWLEFDWTWPAVAMVLTMGALSVGSFAAVLLWSFNK